MADPVQPTTFSHADFALLAAQMATNAADWSASVLMLQETRGQPMPPDSVARFLREMRARLDWIEGRANG